MVLAEQCHSQYNLLNNTPNNAFRKMVDNLQTVASWLSRIENMSLSFVEYTEIQSWHEQSTFFVRNQRL